MTVPAPAPDDRLSWALAPGCGRRFARPCWSARRRSSVVRLLGFAAAALLLLSSPPARADVTWSVASGDWSVATNWSGGALPTSTDNADIYNGGTATITTTGDVCSSLSLGSTAGSGAIQMTGGSLAVGNYAYVGYFRHGHLHAIRRHEHRLQLALLGCNSGSSGTYTLSGSGLLSAPYEYVGYSGTGTFTQSGGTNSISGGTANVPSGLYVGYATGSSGSYSLTGSGLLSIPCEYVGFSGAGTFTQSGGTSIIAGGVAGVPSFLWLGDYGNGTYSLSGGSLSIPYEYVSYVGTGNFTQSGGTNTLSNNLYLGVYASGSGDLQPQRRLVVHTE